MSLQDESRSSKQSEFVQFGVLKVEAVPICWAQWNVSLNLPRWDPRPSLMVEELVAYQLNTCLISRWPLKYTVPNVRKIWESLFFVGSKATIGTLLDQ